MSPKRVFFTVALDAPRGSISARYSSMASIDPDTTHASTSEHTTGQRLALSGRVSRPLER